MEFITRTKILAILIAAALFSSAASYAQIKNFSTYLSKLSSPSVVASDDILLHTSAETLDDITDMRQLDNLLDKYVVGIIGKTPIKNNLAVTTTGSSAAVSQKLLQKQQAVKAKNPGIIAYPQSLPSTNDDSCLALAKRLQDLRVAFDASYRSNADLFNYRVSIANSTHNQLNRIEPCINDEDCYKRHERRFNEEMIAASKDRINANYSLILSQIEQLRPIVESIDATLPKKLPKTMSTDQRNLLVGLASNTKNILLEVSSQIQLQRFYTAECARLMQQ